MPRVCLRVLVVLGALGLGPACGPLVILDDGSESDDESAGEASSTTAATSSTSSAATSVTTTPPDPTTASTTTPPDPTGREPGYCGQTCFAVADCVPPGTDLDDYACVDGFCEWNGEIPVCDPAQCDALMIGFCTEVEGISQCATACVDDSACLAGFTQCTGTDDAGNSICEAIPCFGVAEGEPCDIQGVGQFGVCIDGVCACTDDSQCTLEGFGCNR
jgi:hypothetical protein